MLSSVREWFWRADALKKAGKGPAPEIRTHARTAQDLVDSANSLGGADGTLLAQSLLFSEAVVRSAAALGVERTVDKPPLDDEIVRATLTQRGVPSATVDAARPALQLGEAAPIPKAPAVNALRQVAESLVREANRRMVTPAELLAQRWLRLGLLAMIVVGPLITLTWIYPWWLFDKSRGATWEVSSPHNESKRSGTLGSPPEDFFFASAVSPNPWLIIDLGDVETISKVRVVNRPIHQGDSFPLTVEVSVDREHWEVVGQKPDVYRVWVAKFASRKARYLRLSVQKTGAFALNDVQVI